MDTNLSLLKYQFKHKPLLVGGRAMEYYGLRKSGEDIDLVASEEDIVNLINMYPNRVKDLFGDLGVCPLNFEIWNTICFLNYDELKEDAVDEGEYLVISLEKLLLMKALAMKIEKYHKDTELIVEKILKDKYSHYEEVKRKNEDLLKGIEGISYIERKGDEE